jgi:hypothetical protein
MAMSICRNAGVFAASLEEARFLAECGDLREYSDYPCWMWQDSQTGGGGCRVVWHRGLMWVSYHAGYPGACFSDEMVELALQMGLKEVCGSPVPFGY